MGSSSTGGGDKDEIPDSKAEAELSDSDSPDADGSAALYSEGEKVLAYHGPHIYEAKVQKAELRKEEWKYYVHYLGWSKNWDEWVGTDRLMKFTEENVRKQKSLKKRLALDKAAKSGRTTQNRPRSSSGGRGKKRKVQSSNEEMRSPDKAFMIHFPQTLKKQLVDDWEFVTQLGKLIKLPRTPNVDEILKKYLDYRTKKDGMLVDSVAEILKGIRCYFDKALLSMLLYKKERQQYHEVVSANTSPSTIYGAEHLLRLFVKLPELLVYVNMEEETLAKLQQKLLDFLKYLQKSQSSFFLSTYEDSKEADEADDE